MKTNKKLFIVGNYPEYVNWLVCEPLNFEITKSLEESDAVFFAGGEDISAGLYGEKESAYLMTSVKRDEYEWDIFEKSGNKLKIGVCRGGQLLTVLNGFKLIQHMSHPGMHEILTNKNERLFVTSSHHNQFTLIPNEMSEFSPCSKSELIAWSNKLSPFHLNGDDLDYKFPKNYKEPEIVVFDGMEFGRGISCAIQMHPEWLALDHPSVKFCQSLVLECLDKSKKTSNLELAF